MKGYQHIHTYPQRRKKKVTKKKEETSHPQIAIAHKNKHTSNADIYSLNGRRLDINGKGRTKSKYGYNLHVKNGFLFLR